MKFGPLYKVFTLSVQDKYTKCTRVYKTTVSPLATWFRPGEIGLMGRPCTHERLGGKQGKPKDLVVQTPGAKCGDRGQVKRALWIGVTEGSGHVCPGKLNRPSLLSGGRRRMWDIRRRWDVGRTELRLWDIQIR